MTGPLTESLPSTGSSDHTLARLLRPFGQVEPHEAITAATLTLTVFLLLTAYYFLKTAREPLILLQGGAEVKSYASAGQSLLLLMVIPAYAALARRVGRMRLVISVYGFFALNLLVFALLVRAQVQLGVAFYLWVGVFNVTAIAQFWSFANDIYSPEQGQRLFAILGIGSSIGAIAGAVIASRLASLGPPAMMLSAAVLLVICIGLFARVDQRERSSLTKAGSTATRDAPPLHGPVLKQLLGEKYLLWIAALTFLLNCVNSTGEYLLDRTLLASVTSHGAVNADAGRFIAEFKAEYFGWVNLLGVLLQLFAVSRILRLLGLRKALFILPIVAFASYSLMLAVPMLALIRVGKIAENSLDYSLQNTARQALFLVGSRAEKYLGKTFVDTVVVRTGDVFSAAVVFMAGQLALPIRALALLNLGIVACWMLVLVGLGKEHAQRSRELERASASGT